MFSWDCGRSERSISNEEAGLAPWVPSKAKRVVSRLMTGQEIVGGQMRKAVPQPEDGQAPVFLPPRLAVP